MSRAFGKEEVVAKVNNILLQSTVNWLDEQSKSNEINSIVRLVKHHAPDDDWLAVVNGRRWLSERANLHISTSGILMHSKRRIVCPQHMLDHILHLHHDSPLAGHRAFETTFDAVKLRYFWLNMSTIIKQYCKSCSKCQAFNFSCLHHRAPLQPISVSRPWQLVGTDFMGPFKTSERGNAYIILAIDHLTKFAEGAATVSFDANTTAEFLFNNVVCRHGMFEKLLSDQGVNFESHLLKQLCILLGTDKLHTSTYHAAGNGITERLNKTIKPALAKFVNDDHTDWDAFLPMALSAYNNSIHSTTRMTPYEALYHRPSVQVSDVLLNNQLPFGTKPHTVADFILRVRRSAEHISKMLLDNTQRAQAKQKLQYDRFARDNNEFELGDSVMITNYRQRPGHTKSFEPKFIGPYTIAERITDLNYKLKADNLPSEIVHFNRMEKYHTRRAVIAPNPHAAPPVPLAAASRPQLAAEPKPLAAALYDPPVVLCCLRRSPRLATSAVEPVVVPVADDDDDDEEHADADSDEAHADDGDTHESGSEADDSLYIASLFVDPVDERTATATDLSGEAVDHVHGNINNQLTMPNGKPATQCARCGKLCEREHGIKVHEVVCKKKARRLNRGSPQKQPTSPATSP